MLWGYDRYSSLHLGVILYNAEGQDVGEELVKAELLSPAHDMEGPTMMGGSCKRLVD